MVMNIDGSLMFDLVFCSEGYRVGMDKVGRINDQKMCVMEVCVEKVGKVIGKSLDSLVLIVSSVLDQVLDMLGRISCQVGQVKKFVQSVQDKVLVEWKIWQKELGEVWKSYCELFQDLFKFNEVLLKNFFDKFDKVLFNFSEIGKLLFVNVGKVVYVDVVCFVLWQMMLMLLDGLFGWVVSVGIEKFKVDDKVGKGQVKVGDDEKEQLLFQLQVFKQWLLQMNSVWGVYCVLLQDIFGMIDELFRNVLEKFEKLLFNFVIIGKLFLSNFVKMVIDDVVWIVVWQFLMFVLDGLFGWMNGKVGIIEV